MSSVTGNHSGMWLGLWTCTKHHPHNCGKHMLCRIGGRSYYSKTLKSRFMRPLTGITSWCLTWITFLICSAEPDLQNVIHATQKRELRFFRRPPDPILQRLGRPRTTDAGGARAPTLPGRRKPGNTSSSIAAGGKTSKLPCGGLLAAAGQQAESARTPP
jgi:hypothetical protein